MSTEAPFPQRSGALSSSTRASEYLAEAVEEDERPIRCAKFRQQELWAWKPVWTPRVVFIMYFVVAVIFLPLGAVIFVQSSRLESTPRFRYDNRGSCNIGDTSSTETVGTCRIRFDIERKVEAPSYFYYGLVNFYQNARTYVTSRSDDQLRGTNNPDTGTCDPLENVPGTNQPLVPCGLVANSQFNDTLRLCFDAECEQEVDLKDTGIAWDVDRETRFLGNNESFTDEQNERIRSEDFMVWMRLAAYRNWKKLYRIIPTDLEPGSYYVQIESRFPVSSFDGEKFFFISETTWFGGPNRTMGISYLVVGGVALILAITIMIRSRITPDLDLPPETTVDLGDLVSPSNIQSAPLTADRPSDRNA
ncbi:hypothetical protein FGB62_59g14 [Gracilaria domingensis]|nr:hypothetical protein FGB62_59g14 [Gracilaria domingensis]